MPLESEKSEEYDDRRKRERDRKREKGRVQLANHQPIARRVALLPQHSDRPILRPVVQEPSVGDDSLTTWSLNSHVSEKKADNAVISSLQDLPSGVNLASLAALVYSSSPTAKLAVISPLLDSNNQHDQDDDNDDLSLSNYSLSGSESISGHSSSLSSHSLDKEIQQTLTAGAPQPAAPVPKPVPVPVRERTASSPSLLHFLSSKDSQEDDFDDDEDDDDGGEGEYGSDHSDDDLHAYFVVPVQNRQRRYAQINANSSTPINTHNPLGSRSKSPRSSLHNTESEPAIELFNSRSNSFRDRRSSYDAGNDGHEQGIGREGDEGEDSSMEDLLPLHLAPR